MIRSTPIRRSAPPRRKAQKDPVTPELRAFVLRRDRSCLLASFSSLHVCRDRWGVPHAPWATDLLSIEHVHDGYGMTGKRAPSDPAHCVALCYSANVGGPSKDARAFFRSHLAEVSR